MLPRVLRVSLVVWAPCFLLLGSIAAGGGYLPHPDGSASFEAGTNVTAPNATVVATIPLPGPFLAVPTTFSPDTGDLYLITSGGIDVINGSNNSYQGEIPAPFGSSNYVVGGLAYDPANRELYGAWTNATLGPNFGHAYLGAFSTVSEQIASVIPLSSGTVGVGGLDDIPMYDAQNGNVYVPLGGAPGAIAVVSAASNTVLAKLTVGTDPITPVVDADTGNLYVVNSLSQNISVISGTTDTVIASISLGSAPSVTGVSQASIDSSDGTLFATSAFSPTVGVQPTDYLQGVSLANLSVFANRSLSSESSAPFLDPESNAILVGSLHNLTAFNASTGDTMATIPTEPLFSSPGFPLPQGSFTLNPSKQLVYAEAIQTLGLAVISLTTNRDVSNLTVSTSVNTVLTGPTFDSDNGEVYLPMEIMGSSTEVLVIGAGAPSSGTSSSLVTPLLLGLGIGAVVIVAAAVLLVRRSRRAHR